jgi:hypothetical protein
MCLKRETWFHKCFVFYCFGSSHLDIRVGGFSLSSSPDQQHINYPHRNLA